MNPPDAYGAHDFTRVKPSDAAYSLVGSDYDQTCLIEHPLCVLVGIGTLRDFKTRTYDVRVVLDNMEGATFDERLDGIPMHHMPIVTAKMSNRLIRRYLDRDETK